jgi:ADP-L-glycero-D-manno-heptose 6-epimerase
MYNSVSQLVNSKELYNFYYLDILSLIKNLTLKDVSYNLTNREVRVMIIVTGGAGFVGSNLVKGLNRQGIDDIIIVDNLTNSKKQKNLNTLKFSDYIDKVDFIENLNSFKHYKIDAIMHQGACSDTLEEDGRYMMHNNYDYSKKLLGFAVEKNTRFIYASSASVYGNGDSGFEEDEKNEYPLNVYAFSKFLFDRYIRNMINNVNIQIVGLRYFNVYGPQETHKGKMASVVYHFHNEILEDGTIKLFEGSENFRRDFVFVDDVVDVNLFFLNNPSLKGIYNCGTGEAKPFLRIAEIMQTLYDNVRIEFIKFPNELKEKYQTFTQADLTNLRNAGYDKEFTKLDDGVKQYTDILKSNQGYYR